MRYFIVFSYLLAAAINLAPVLGMLSDAMLNLLYAVPVPSAELSLLLKHRAALFGIVGGFLLTATFLERYRTSAGIAGLASMLSFVALFLLSDVDSSTLRRVMLIDAWVAVIFVAGFICHLRTDLPRRN